VKNRWSLREAKDRLSHVVEQAVVSGPQTITVRGQEKVVVVAAEEYKRLTTPSIPLTEFFRQSPLYGMDLDLERSGDTGRDIDL